MKPCGTEAAYRRHRSRGEEPCPEDRAAVAEANLMRERAKGRRPWRPVRCGTRSGYQAHLDRGEPTCAACREAHAEHHRARRRGQSTSNRSDRQTLGELILDLLETHGRPLTTLNLTDMASDIRGPVKEGTVRTTLLRLAKDGRVENWERYDGWYWRLREKT